MSVLSWARRRFGLTDGSVISMLFGGGTWAGRPVTQDTALNVSAWWRSTKLYAEVAGSLPLKFYERLDTDERISARDHPVAGIIGFDPNSEQTTQEFWGAQAAALCTTGNSYAEKRFVGDRLVSLELMPFDTIPYRTTGGELRYKFTDRGKSEDLPRDKVFHTRGFSFGGDLGLSPLSYARQTLGLALVTEEAAAKTYSQGMRMSGFFKSPVTLLPEQRDQVKKVLIEQFSGNDATAKAGLLEGGFDWVPANITPRDAEMLLSRRFNVEDVCRWMGVPPILVGHSAEGQTMWGTGVEAILLAWLTLGLDSFLKTFETSINKRLLKPEERRRYFAEFDRRALLRADSTARGEFYWKLVQIAGMTPNQICDKENFPRFDGGDVRLINQTLIPLHLAGKQPAALPKPETVQ